MPVTNSSLGLMHQESFRNLVDVPEILPNLLDHTEAGQTT